jgi:hypothetical protein
MAKSKRIVLPRNTSPFAVRLKWAGNRYADLCADKMTREEGKYVWNVIVGWTDFANPDETRQLNALAQCFSTLIRS